MAYFHDSLTGGHLGIYRTWSHITVTFYWAGIKADVKWYVVQCDSCQRVKTDLHKPSGLLQPLLVPSRIWEDLTINFIEGLPISNGFNGIMVVIDRC